METPVNVAIGGRILDIVKRQGEYVERGDILLIFEAMKMYNEVKSPVNGVIKTVYVFRGERVREGQLCMMLTSV